MPGFNAITVRALDLATIVSFGPFPTGTLVRQLSLIVGNDTAGSKFNFRIAAVSRSLGISDATEFGAGRRLDLNPGNASSAIELGVEGFSGIIFLNHVIEPGLPVVAFRVLTVAGDQDGIISCDAYTPDMFRLMQGVL